MAYTFPAMVAWDPNAKQAVLNTVWQAFATSDTSFTAPLAILDPFGQPILNNQLNSGAQGIIPQFQQITNASVVVRDLAGHYAWTIIAIQPPTQDANVATFLNTKTSQTAGAIRAISAGTWQAGTVYAAGQPVVTPAGDLVTVSTPHTSGASYDATKFTLTNKATDADVANAIPGTLTSAALAKTYASANDGMTLTRLERKGILASQRFSGKHVTSYMDASETDEDWSSLANSNASANVSVSGNKLYGTGSNPPIALRWFPVAAGAKAHAVGSFMYVTGASGTHAFYAGFEMLGNAAAPAVNTPTGIGIGQQNGVAQGFRGSSIPAGVGTPAPAGFTLTGGLVYEWSVTVDETKVSLAMREQGSASNFTSWVADRAALTTAGFSLNRFFIYVQDSRTTTGHYALPYSIVGSGQTPRVKTVGGSTVLGTTHKDVRTTSASGDAWHIQIPNSYDPRSPAPLCMYFHQAQTGTAEHPFTDSRETPIVKALGDAGFIFASADDGGDRWGNQASLDAYLSLYQYVQSHYAIGPVVFLAVSMGGMPALNLLAQRKFPNVAAIAGISPVCDLSVLYANSTYTAAIATAYGISGSNYATQTAGYNPMLDAGTAFRGVPARFYTGPTDTIVPPATNATPFLAAISPYAAEATQIVESGGHLDASQYQASDLVSFFQNYV